MGYPKPIASLGGAWHAHDEGGEAFPTCPKCLEEIQHLKNAIGLAQDLLDEVYPSWREEIDETLAEMEQEGDE